MLHELHYYNLTKVKISFSLIVSKYYNITIVISFNVIDNLYFTTIAVLHFSFLDI